MDMGGEFRNNLSNKQINELIDSLCTIRMENPDVLAMDNINNQRVDNMDPFERERLEIETDRVNIEADILRNIFENTSTPMSFEEINELKAKGLYDKYMDNNKKRGVAWCNSPVLIMTIFFCISHCSKFVRSP